MGRTLLDILFEVEDLLIEAKHGNLDKLLNPYTKADINDLLDAVRIMIEENPHA